MFSSYLRVWKTRGSSAGALGDSSNLNSEPYCHEFIYHIGVCSLASGLPGHYLSPSAASRTWKVLEWTAAWLLLRRSALCSHLPLWHSGELKVVPGISGECEEQFMCRNTLDSMWMRRGVLYAKILEGPNHWRFAFGKLRHTRTWFPTTNLCSVGCNNQLCVRQGMGLKALGTPLQKHVPMILVPGEGKGTVQITGDTFWVC